MAGTSDYWAWWSGLDEVTRSEQPVGHLTSDQTVGLFGRIHEALAPGGLLAIRDTFAEPHRRTAGAANFLGLFAYLSYGSQVDGAMHVVSKNMA